jgi:hypothetical protein
MAPGEINVRCPPPREALRGAGSHEYSRIRHRRVT